MKTLTFERGVHPPDSKSYTNDKPITIIMPKVGALMVFPMLQHTGAPCEPTVKVGDEVLVGQKIGESTAFVSSPIYSSVSGVVKEIKEVLTPAGFTSKAVIIENDGEMKENSSLGKVYDYLKMSKEEILNVIKEAGVVGSGGAGFPAHVKLNPPPEKKIEYILMNAAECEPYLTNDHRVMLEETEKVIKGFEIILSLHKGAKGIIGVETNKQNAIDVLSKYCKENNIQNIEVVGLVPKYPQGSEKQLIFACTGRTVPSGKLPMDVGCIVNNVETVVGIYRAFYKGRPVMRRIVTVTGGAVNNAGNYKVRLGMSYADMLEAIGGFKTEPCKLLSGGPMMGMAIYTLDLPIMKTSAALICLTEAETDLPKERNCIRCGKCVTHCPANLMPFQLNQFVIFGQIELFEKNNGLDCIECGCCSYICPAKRHLAQSIRATRRRVMSMKKR